MRNEEEDRAEDLLVNSTMEKYEDIEIKENDNGKTDNGEMDIATEENTNIEEDGQAEETSTPCKLGGVSEASNLEYKEPFEEEDPEKKAEEEEVEKEESPSDD